MALIDSHCHLNMLKPKEGDVLPGDAIKRANEAGVVAMMNISVDRETVAEVLQAARDYECVYASVGVHPSTENEEEVTVDELLELADWDKVLAIGEAGLDFYYHDKNGYPETKPENKPHEHGDLEASDHSVEKVLLDNKTIQEQRFITHLEASKRSQKPIVIHTRDAREETIRLLRAHGWENGGVLHCFTESWEMAKQALDLGYYISFSGIVTFKNALELKEVAKKVPLDRMLVETDSPYLSPVPHRGKPNEPARVADVARYVAELKGCGYGALCQQTTENFCRLFNLPIERLNLNAGA